MDREEILNRAVKENKGKDYADLEAVYKGGYVGTIVVAALATILAIVEAIVTRNFNYSYYFIWASMQTGIFIYKFIKQRKKHELLITFMYSLMTVFFFVLYILTMTGVL